MKYIIGNWKAHKNIQETKEWIETFNSLINDDQNIQAKLQNNEQTVIICPPFHAISLVKSSITQLPNIHVGSQDLSSFEQGNYTGEISASIISDLINFSIVGHSERRVHLHETEEIIAQKIENAKKESIQSILCVRDENDILYSDATFVAYEPMNAIGNGNNVSVDDVLNIKSKLSLQPHQKFIYGGSVNQDNYKEYLSNPEIDGVLVGTASFNALSFVALLQ